jgi:hypothetical protein
MTYSNEYADNTPGNKPHLKVGAFGRYYTGKGRRSNGTIQPLRFFVQAGFAYGVVNGQMDDYLWTSNVLDLRIMPGINYFIKPRIALEAGLGGTFEFPDMGKQGRFLYNPNLGLRFFPGLR